MLQQQPLRLSCYVAIQAFKPDLIISAGTAGGFKSAGGEIADVYISSKCVFHSRRIPDSGTGYSEYGFGHYRSPPLEILANQVKCKIGVISTSDSLDFTPKDLQIMRGEGASIKEMEAAAIACKFLLKPILFSSTFAHKLTIEYEFLTQRLVNFTVMHLHALITHINIGFVLAINEGVCQQCSIPFIGVKSITDIVDNDKNIASVDEFEQNLAKASERLQEKLTLILSLMAEHSLSDWSY